MEIKPSRGCGVVLAFLTCAGGLAHASDPVWDPTGTNSRPSLVAEVKLEEGPGLIPARRALITLGEQKFSFVVPSRFRVELIDAQKLVLVTPDLGATMTFRLASSLKTSGLGHEQCREWLMQNFTGATVQEELALSAMNENGPAFDAQWSPKGRSLRQARIAYFPSRAGVVEVSVVCPQDQWKVFQYDYNFILLTLRASDEKGQLDSPILSNKL